MREILLSGPPGFRWLNAYDPAVSYISGDTVRYDGRAWRAKGGAQGIAPPSGYPVSDTAQWELVADRGAVAWVDRGVWTSAASYIANDAVHYAGSYWRARRPNTGVIPVEGADWTLIVAKGDPGLVYQGDYVLIGTQTLPAGSVATAKATAWVAVSSVPPNNPPSMDSPYWEPLATGLYFAGDWASGTRYEENWVIRYNNSLYRVMVTHTSNALNPPDVNNAELLLPGVSGTDLASTTDATKGSRLVGWLSSLTGAVGRYVSDKLAERISVKDFGANGDGVTLTTTALQAAINAVQGTGAVLYVPPGTYLTGGLTATQTISIELSPGATIKLANTSNATLLTLNGVGSRIRGGVFDGNKVNQTAGNGIVLNGAGSKVKNVEVKDIFTWGIYSPRPDIEIVGNNVHDTGSISIFIQASGVSADEGLIAHNRVRTTTAEGGIKVRGDNSTLTATRMRILGNHVEGVAQICIEAFGLSTKSVIANNTTNGGIMGVSISASSYCTIVGNTCEGADTYGIELASSSYCTVVGNVVHGAGLTNRGIAVTGTASKFNVINANTVNGVVDYGITLTTASDHSVISSNIIDGYGIHGIYPVNTDGFTITDNTIINGGLKAVMIENCQNGIIANNRGKTATQNGILLFQSGAGVTDNIIVSGNHMVSTNAAYAEQGTVGVSISYQMNYPFTRYSATPPGAASALVATSAIGINYELQPISATAAITLTSAPTIADGKNGQRIRIINTGSFDITLQDQGTLANSNLRLEAASITLTPRDSVELTYMSLVGDWVQTGKVVAVL